jgi:hypothetical protein
MKQKEKGEMKEISNFAKRGKTGKNDPDLRALIHV